jgi:ATP-dependent Clp protease ATP-binding subunit ClpA
MYERLTDRARKVMGLAKHAAQRLNHEYIGTEHILLGLVEEGSGVAANVLKSLDVSLRKVRKEVEKIVMAGPDAVTMTKLPQTPRAKKVIEYAVEEARSLNHNYVGTEHLLLGLLREQEGIAAQVLLNLGLNLQDVRQEVLNLLGVGMHTERAGGHGQADIPLVQPDLSAVLDQLPGEVNRALLEINGHLEKLVLSKEHAVAEQAFEKAARLRDQEDKLKRQLLDAVKSIQTLIRLSENEPQ